MTVSYETPTEKDLKEFKSLKGCDTVWVAATAESPQFGVPFRCDDGILRMPVADKKQATGYIMRVKVTSQYNDYMDAAEDWSRKYKFQSCPARELTAGEAAAIEPS